MSGGLTSLATAVSGLRAAQAGLIATGHNISNSDTTGYVRQQIIQQDFLSTNLGTNRHTTLQVGLGTDIASTRQIRDKFLDISYREQTCKLAFYDVKYSTGVELETIIGEMEGEYRLQDVLSDMWNAINELSIDPTGLESRGVFVTTAKTFIDKVNNIYERTYEYQKNLNDRIKKEVQTVNNLIIKVDNMNKLIMDAEISGDNANDYRDVRNNALDELSAILKIDYKELSNGSVNILTNGSELLVNGNINTLGLRYSSQNWEFVEPVFSSSKEILEYDATGSNAAPLYKFLTDVSAGNGNDQGSLKALMISRGFSPANYTMTPDSYADGSIDQFNVTNCLIPKVQMEIDTMVHSIVTLINDTFAPYIDSAGTNIQDPDAPVGLDGTQHMEIFSRIVPAYQNRYNAAGELIEEDPNERYSLYSIGNIELNPLLMNSSSYDKIAVSISGDVSDNRTVIDTLMKKWKEGFIGVDSDEKLSVDNYYKKIVSNLGINVNEAKKFYSTQQDLLSEIDNKRKAISGVSIDEEMKNMLVYQHAYNASARIVSIIDSMIDKIVNGTGRVGL